MATSKPQNSGLPLEENLKKALTELLVLRLLSQREYYIGDLSETLKKQSNEALNIVFPYSAVYRLQEEGYILEADKRIAPDGRKRQFFRISPQGLLYYRQLLVNYHRFIDGVNAVLFNNA